MPSTYADRFDVAFAPPTALTDDQIERLAQVMEVALKQVGRFWNGVVDDGQGFPCPDVSVVEYYCPICNWRTGNSGEGWCEHKAAVRNALLDELDDAPLPFDRESEAHTASLKRAIAAFEAVRE